MALFKMALWEDPQTKQRVRARRVVDGGSEDMIIDRNDKKNWDLLIAEYPESEIDRLTQEDIEKFRSERRKLEAQSKEQQEREYQEMVFAEKLAAFEIPEIKQNKNSIMKRRLRKASNMLEVYVYSAALVIDYDKQEASV